jgi:hypothetical protein
LERNVSHYVIRYLERLFHQKGKETKTYIKQGKLKLPNFLRIICQFKLNLFLCNVFLHQFASSSHKLNHENTAVWNSISELHIFSLLKSKLRRWLYKIQYRYPWTIISHFEIIDALKIKLMIGTLLLQYHNSVARNTVHSLRN